MADVIIKYIESDDVSDDDRQDLKEILVTLFTDDLAKLRDSIEKLRLHLKSIDNIPDEDEHMYLVDALRLVLSILPPSWLIKGYNIQAGIVESELIINIVKRFSNNKLSMEKNGSLITKCINKLFIKNEELFCDKLEIQGVSPSNRCYGFISALMSAYEKIGLNDLSEIALDASQTWLIEYESTTKSASKQ